MSPLVKHLTFLVAGAILAGGVLDAQPPRLPLLRAVQRAPKKGGRHPRRVHPRRPSRKVAPLPRAR